MDEKLLQIEKDAYNYFMDFTSFNETNKTYGLTKDHSQANVATIAGIGFFLPALIIGAERGYLSKSKALEITIKTLKNLKGIDHFQGMFVHFIDLNNGLRHKKNEYSTIDTWIAFLGMLAADNYYKNFEVSNLVNYFISRFNFQNLIFDYQGKKCFRMSYNPDQDGDYVENKPGYIYQWHMFSEALIVYPLFAGITDNVNEAKALYNGFERRLIKVENYDFYHTPGNALFVYQLPIGFIDFSKYVDEDNVNWFSNAKNAITANYLSSIKNHTDPNLKEYGWGATASDSPRGYRVYGPKPNYCHLNYPDGTYCPSAIVSSLPFLKEISEVTLNKFDDYQIKGKYGYFDSFNLRINWVSNRYYAFNKGMELIFSNLELSGLIQKLITEHELIQKGLKKLGFRRL